MLNKKEIKETIKKSYMTANTSFDLDKITRKRMGLVPCSYINYAEEVEFVYNTEGLKGVSLLTKEDFEKRYQFLINFSETKEIFNDYKVDINSIFYDENMRAYFLRRDLYNDNEEKADFLMIYKIVVGGILSKKYSISQIYESGIEIIKEEKALKPILGAKSSKQIVFYLKKVRDIKIEREKRTKIKINRNANTLKNVLSIISPILFLACFCCLIYETKIVNPRNEMIIKGNQAYNQVVPDYEKCIESMKKLDIHDMDKNTKYILARSYAKAESLKKDEVDEIVSKLSVQSDDRQLEYWINLGRLNINKAQDIAKSLSDDKLLMYAYMKELDRLGTDVSISGNKKQKRIKELEDNIKSLGEKYMPKQEYEESKTNIINDEDR